MYSSTVQRVYDRVDYGDACSHQTYERSYKQLNIIISELIWYKLLINENVRIISILVWYAKILCCAVLRETVAEFSLGKL